MGGTRREAAVAVGKPPVSPRTGGYGVGGGHRYPPWLERYGHGVILQYPLPVGGYRGCTECSPPLWGSRVGIGAPPGPCEPPGLGSCVGMGLPVFPILVWGPHVCLPTHRLGVPCGALCPPLCPLSWGLSGRLRASPAKTGVLLSLGGSQSLPVSAAWLLGWGGVRVPPSAAPSWV